MNQFSISTKFSELRTGSITLEKFEKWVYGNESIQTVIGESNYLDLININYKEAGSLHQVSKILEEFIDESYLQTKHLKSILSIIILREEKAADCLLAVYDAYCEGYHFLQDLALKYAIALVSPDVVYGVEDFFGLTESQKESILDDLYPDARIESMKISNALNGKLILLTGQREPELGKWQYKDHRTAK